VSNRKQTAIGQGYGCGRGAEIQGLKRAATGSFFSESGQSLGRIDQRPGTFPETNFFRQPAKSGSACALNGRRQQRPGAGKG